MPLTKIENPERILWCIWNTGYKQAQNLGRLALTLPYFSSSQILSHQMLLCLPLIAPEIFCFLIVPVLSIPFMDHSLVTAKGINSMKPCAMPCRATQDRWGHSEEFWQNVVHWRKKCLLQYSCLENPVNSMKRQKDMTLEDEPTRSEGVQRAAGEEQRAITNSSRKNEWLSQSRNDG